MKFRIIMACLSQGITDVNQIKYVIATVKHETNGTYKPVREAYWVRNKMIKKHGEKKGSIRFEKWAKRNFRYYPYYGRGFVQITWKTNYKKFGKLLNIDLVNNPDLALKTENALFILVYGMKHGSFTGKKLDNYINKEKVDFRRARRIINGNDKAKHIASIAKAEKVWFS